jgi:hypothetical protein
MAEQEFSFLDQIGLGPSQAEQQTASSYGISLPEPSAWDKSLSESYSPSILPINPSINSDVIGNTPQPPATPGDFGKYSTENYADGIADLIKTSNQWAQDPGSYAQPFSYGAGWRAGNFERYYASPSFKKLGYFPGRDNEAIYNENTGFLGEFSRMVPAMAGLTVDAFQDMASEWGSWGLDDPDTAMAEDFQHAMSVGMSSKGGVGGFVTNLSLNLAYPLGIMGEMFAEDLVLSAITAASFGGAAEFTVPTMAARAARGFQKIGEAFTNIGNFKQGLSTAYDAVRSIKDLNKARELYNAAKLGKVANFLNPFEHTLDYAKNYDKLKGIGDWAKRARGAHALYRDARFINAVTGEAKLEAGFRKIEHSDELINDYYNQNGVLPSGKDLEKIDQNASNAAFGVTLTNIPMIFLTDKIIFDTAFKGSKFLKTPEEVGEQILSKTGKKLIVENGVPKVISRYSGDNLKRVFTPKALAAKSMRYLGKNFAQGIQESTQDVIQESFGEYYRHVYKDPTTASFAASMGTGLNNQLTAQGFETFLSGFFMGGALGVVQSGLWNILGKGKQIFDPKGYQEFQNSVDNYINQFTNTYNEIATNPTKVVSALRGLESAMVRSKDMAEFAEFSGLDTDSVKEVIDAQDEQVFSALMGFIEAGHGNHLTNIINDFKGLSNDDLAKAFGVDPTADDAGADAKKRLDVFEKRVNLASSLWKNSFKELVNPVDFKKAKQEGDVIALAKYKQFEEYRKFAVFHFYSLSRAIDRQESIYGKLMAMEMGNIPSTEVSPLFTVNALNDHINTLTYEIKALKEIDPVEYKKKQKELDQYKEYREVLKGHMELLVKNAELNLIGAELLHGEDYLEVKEISEKEVKKSKNQLRAAYKKIIKSVAKTYDTPLLNKDLDNMFSMVHDNLVLYRDIRDIADIADTITNPQHMRELLDRWYPEVLGQLEGDKFKLYAEGLKKFFDKEAVDTLTRKLFKIGVVLPEEQLIGLMAKPPLPVTEVVDLSTNKKIPVTEGKGLQAKELIDKFMEAYTPKPEEGAEAATAAEPSAQAKKEDPGVGEDATVKEQVVAGKRIGKGVPLAKYPNELSDLKASLQAAFEAENKRRKEDNEPEISEITFLEGPIAMDIMDDYYEAKEKKVTPAPAAAPVTPTPTPTPTPAPTTDIVQTYEYKGKTQTVKKEVSTKDGITKVTFTGERSDKPDVVNNNSGYVYGGPTSNSVQQFFDDYGVTIEDIAEDLSIDDIKAIQVKEERTGEGKTAITFRITYSQKMGGMSSEPMEMAVKKQKFTSDTELAATKTKTTQQPQKSELAVSNKYKGSIVYVSPGAGKSFLFNLYSNIIDTDEMIKTNMERSGMKKDPNETIGQFIVRGFETDKDKMARIYAEVLQEMKSFASLGYTVLTGSNRWIPEADHVILTEDDAKLEANLKGGMTVEEFRNKEIERLKEPAKPERTVDYLTEGTTLEEFLTKKEKGEVLTFNPIDLINESKNIKELKENWEKVVSFHENSQTTIGPDIQLVYEAKLTDLTRNITSQTVEIGSKLKVRNNVRSSNNSNFVELFAGNVIEVISKNSKGVTVAKVQAIPTTGRKKTIYLTNNRFDAMGASLYDASVPDEVIPTPAAENEEIAKKNEVINEETKKKHSELIAQVRKKNQQDPGSKPDDAKPC